MGFDIQRFPHTIDEEFICKRFIDNRIFHVVLCSGSICGGVLEDPLQAPTCEHIFCRACIEEWLSRSSTCPIDRTSIDIEQLKGVPRILKNLLNRLVMRQVFSLFI